MTISTAQSETITLGNGVTTNFNFNWVYNSAEDVQVIYTNAEGINITLSPSQYTLILNPPLTGQIWGVGGTVTYPISGSPIADGTSLTISRQVPLTQVITISNQGDFAPQVIEEALDTLEMQIQQVAAAQIQIDTITSYVFICGPVTGTPNQLIVNSTSPGNFSLNEGTLITFIPTQVNTGSSTLNILDTGDILLQKLSPSGPANLTQGDLIPAPLLAQYINGVWILISVLFTQTVTPVSSPQVLSILTTFAEYYLTADVTFTVDKTTNLPLFWWTDINAGGGAATITPNAADVINFKGKAYAAGTSFIIPQGENCRLLTDGNRNLYVNFIGPRLAKIATVASVAGTTDVASSSSNIVNISGTNTITSLGNNAINGNPLYFIRFTGALTLTHNGTSLILPGAQNITTVANDGAIFEYLGSGNWICLFFNPSTITGTGSGVRSTSPSFTTPTLGVATASSVKLTGTNPLNYYDSGTITPSLIAVTFSTPGDISVSYTTRDVTWTRIGNRVFLRGYILTSAFTYTTSSGGFTITGCAPFPPVDLNLPPGPTLIDGFSSISGGPVVVINTSGNISIYFSGTGARGQVTTTQSPSGSNKEIYFTIAYQV